MEGGIIGKLRINSRMRLIGEAMESLSHLHIGEGLV